MLGNPLPEQPATGSPVQIDGKQDPPKSSVWTDEENAIISEGFAERFDAYRREMREKWAARPESRWQQRNVKIFTDPDFWIGCRSGAFGRRRAALGLAFPFISTATDWTLLNEVTGN
jgi:hypothetical protein